MVTTGPGVFNRLQPAHPPLCGATPTTQPFSPLWRVAFIFGWRVFFPEFLYTVSSYNTYDTLILTEAATVALSLYLWDQSRPRSPSVTGCRRRSRRRCVCRRTSLPPSRRPRCHSASIHHRRYVAAECASRTRGSQSVHAPRRCHPGTSSTHHYSPSSVQCATAHPRVRLTRSPLHQIGRNRRPCRQMPAARPP